MAAKLNPKPAQVNTTAKTNVVNPKIAAKVATIEKRSFQAFISFHEPYS
jgi:hypothetical protein